MELNPQQMNLDNFASLKSLKDSLECEPNNNLAAMEEIKNKCLEAIQLIDDLRFKNNSAHVQLATKQALQYLNKALIQLETYTRSYNPATGSSVVSVKDICSPAHAGLEVILNLNY